MFSNLQKKPGAGPLSYALSIAIDRCPFYT